ncbi:MAG TPA: hypothetical protein VGQ83_24305 [Polyangia bacterium]|jgi:hypothetical protein
MSGFAVQPVRRYDLPRYPTTCLEPEPTEQAERRFGPREAARWLVVALLVLGLSMLLIACGDRGRLGTPPPPRLDGGALGDGSVPPPDGALPPPDGGADDGGDILAGDIAQCTPADLYCADGHTLMTCETYSYVAVDCDTYCPATYGPQSVSQGCDTTAAEPCQCYDMLDGGRAECTPDEVMCPDPTTITSCDPTTGGYVTTTCAEYCVLHYGPDSLAAGCDAAHPDNPCGCD